MRQRILLAMGGLIALMVFVLMASAQPAQASKAEPMVCNPCDCENDNRENCQGIEFYAFYAREIRGECTLDFYRFNGQGIGFRVMRVRESELEDVEIPEEQNTLIRQREGIALYRLTSGEYQVSAGPDQNSKVYFVVFNVSCPANVTAEGSWEAR